MGGGPCDFTVSPSPFGLDFGTLDFGTSDLGLTISKIDNKINHKQAHSHMSQFSNTLSVSLT